MVRELFNAVHCSIMYDIKKVTKSKVLLLNQRTSEMKVGMSVGRKTQFLFLFFSFEQGAHANNVFCLFVCFVYLKNYLFIYLFMAVLGLRFCARAFSSCGKRGPLFIAVRGPLTIAASLVAEHRLQTRRLSSCGAWAQLLWGMWDLPGPGLEPVSPALAGRFSTTVPPGKPEHSFLKLVLKYT